MSYLNEIVSLIFDETSYKYCKVDGCPYEPNSIWAVEKVANEKEAWNQNVRTVANAENFLNAKIAAGEFVTLRMVLNEFGLKPTKNQKDILDYGYSTRLLFKIVGRPKIVEGMVIDIYPKIRPKEEKKDGNDIQVCGFQRVLQKVQALFKK